MTEDPSGNQATRKLAGGAGSGSSEHAAETWDLEHEVAFAAVSRRLTGDAVAAPSIGRYLVIDRLGAGAMGVVLRAYDPKLHREVALKIVRPDASVDAEQARNRLLREAQALARLSHPNVVAVYDAEATDRGVCIAMEYVQGRTLRAWLAETPRGWRRVVEVALAIARGLAAAHARGLVHRDVKPDNVLIGASDGQSIGRVCVTDFGLARAQLDEAWTGDPALGDFGPTETLTRTGTLMGTPAYMAPEQHAGEPADARADQYALCVLLWEALNGARPFRAHSFEALGRLKREGPPPRSSRQVPAWLHAVLTRGLAVDPAQRFASCDALAQALASGQSRVTKRRAALGVSALALVGVGALLWRQHDRAQRQAACERAGQTLATIWNDDTQTSIRAAFVATGASYAEATHAKLVPWIDRWTQTWARARADACMAATVMRTYSDDDYGRVVACLDERRDELEGLLDALARADATTVQRAVTAATNLSGVEPCADLAMLSRRSTSPPDASTRSEIEIVRREIMRRRGASAAGRYTEDLQEAERLLASAVAIDHGPLIDDARLLVGNLASQLGRFDRAAEVLQQASIDAGARGDDALAARALVELTFVIGYQAARFEEGLAWAAAAELFVRRIDHSEDPLGASLLNNRAVLHYARGDHETAVALHERAIALRERLFGDDHPELATSLNNLANARTALGELDQAVRLHERALAIQEIAYGSEHPIIAHGLNNLAIVLLQRDEHEAAAPLLERALAIRRRALGPEDRLVAQTLVNMGLMAANTGDRHTARQRYEQALRILEAQLGPDHLDVAAPLVNLANLSAAQGDHAAAEPLYLRVLAIRETALGPDHPAVAQVLTSLGWSSGERGDPVQAQRYHERALALREKAFGAQHAVVAEALVHLANSRREQGAYDDAWALLQRAVAIAEIPDGRDPIAVAHPLLALGEVALARGRPNDAIGPLERAASIVATTDESDLRARVTSALARATGQRESAGR